MSGCTSAQIINRHICTVGRIQLKKGDTYANHPYTEDQAHAREQPDRDLPTMNSSTEHERSPNTKDDCDDAGYITTVLCKTWGYVPKDSAFWTAVFTGLLVVVTCLLS